MLECSFTGNIHLNIEGWLLLLLHVLLHDTGMIIISYSMFVLAGITIPYCPRLSKLHSTSPILVWTYSLKEQRLYLMELGISEPSCFNVYSDAEPSLFSYSLWDHFQDTHSLWITSTNSQSIPTGPCTSRLEHALTSKFLFMTFVFFSRPLTSLLQNRGTRPQQGATHKSGPTPLWDDTAIRSDSKGHLDPPRWKSIPP